MRFFLFLAAALVAALSGQVIEELGVSYKLPDGLPKGAILTFFFYHRHHATFDGSEPVSLNFFEVDYVSVQDYKNYGIDAHLRIMSDDVYPLASNTFMNGEWQRESNPSQALDDRPPWTAWWRVDVIRVSDLNLNVFFQGYWSGERTFAWPITSIHSVYLISEFVDYNSVQVILKMPNDNIAPLSFLEFTDFVNVRRSDFDENRKLFTFPNFPQGASIEMSVVLRASGDATDRRPSINFESVHPAGGDSAFFMKIVQIWQGRWTDWPRFPAFEYTQIVYLSKLDQDPVNLNPREIYSGDAHIPCTTISTRPNGDLLHLKLTRTEQQMVKMDILYKGNTYYDPSTPTSFSCEASIAMWSVEEFVWNKPFNLVSHHGAVILHLEHNIPMAEEPKND